MERNHLLLVSEGRRPLLHLILAALALTRICLLLILFFTGHNLANTDVMYKKYQVGALIGAIMLLGPVVLFSRIKNVLIDRDSARIMEQWQIGPFKYGKWEPMGEIAYISVFRAKKTYSINFDKNAPARYEVNLWFKKGRRKMIYSHQNKEVSITWAREVAKKLKVDFSDSSDPHSKKRISWTTL